MKRYFITAAFFTFVACNANTHGEAGKSELEVRTNEAAISKPDMSAKGDKKKTKADTFCYVIADGENNENINAVKLIINGDKVTGELKYITAGQPPAAGQLNGNIKDGIITADWTFVKQSNYYKIPVTFKMTGNAVFQKPSAVNAEGQAYIPEDGEYSYEFPLVNCEYYPQ